jgi:hypothetical protein
MALGGTTSDLEEGDVLGPLPMSFSPFMVREYCHAVEIGHEFFQGAADQIVPPTLIHLEKLRLYRHCCPKGPGPTARIHYQYDATFHEAVRAGETLTVRGVVESRTEKRGRTYVVMRIDLTSAADDRLLIEYRDTDILAFQPGADTGAAQREPVA